MTTESMPMSTAAAPGFAAAASTVRRLYFVRFAFAIVWALVALTTAKHLGPLAATLFVLYPLFDVASAFVDARASRTTGAPTLQYVNMAISALAAIGLAFAAG